MLRALVCVVVMAALIGSGEARADTVLGRWCDKMIPAMPKYNAVLTIVITNDGTAEIRSKFGDGSSGTNALREATGGFYEKIGSGVGEKYRVVPTTGNLQLIDNDGLIRIAVRLENKPRDGDCIR